MQPIAFVALKTFYSPDLQSHYVTGLSYTARPDDHILRLVLPRWVKEGRIALGLAGAKVQGKG